MKIQVGRIGVDAGCVMVGDPCYFLYRDQPDEMIGRATGARTWHEFVKHLYDELTFERSPAVNINDGLCVISHSGWGDGSYPVYVEVDEATQRVKQLTVEFMEEEEEEDEDDADSDAKCQYCGDKMEWEVDEAYTERQLRCRSCGFVAEVRS